jgi:hypothetical protein
VEPAQDGVELLAEAFEPADDVIVDDVGDEQVRLAAPVVVEDARIVEQALDIPRAALMSVPARRPAVTAVNAAPISDGPPAKDCWFFAIARESATPGPGKQQA